MDAEEVFGVQNMPFLGAPIMASYRYVRQQSPLCLTEARCSQRLIKEESS
jgi:hypothetical protein